MRWFASNIRTLLLALVLAIAVWISAVTSADPDEVRKLPAVPLSVIGQDPSLININEVPATVEVTLRAPRSVWERLIAQENSVQATLDLSGLGSGEYTVGIKLTITERPYQIVVANPTSLTVQLEPLATRTLAVELLLSGEPALGYQAAREMVNPKTVTISGPDSIVKEAIRAKILISLAGARGSIDQSIRVQVVDEKNNQLRGISVSPELIHVNIPISQLGGFRDVAVKVVVQGEQAAGYRIVNVSVFPPVVTLFASDPDLVNELPGVVETQPLDIQDAKSDISTRLALNLPENISIIGSKTVQVQVGVSPIQTSLTLVNQKINVIGLAEGLAARVSPQTVDVIISGPSPVLDTLTPQDVVINVDVSGLEIGIHQLVPKWNVVISNVLVESILPGTVEVIIFIPDTPTPTAVP
ncbi:MAG TPA: CdaR family protein [Anaerolineales bacterium]|nr:CdaR family protein [Anaerolineales bacterium]